MRLAMVRTAADEPSVAVESNGGWVPLLTAPGADRLGPARTDLLAFLAAGEQVHQLAQELAAGQPPPAQPDQLLGLPFRPAAFRDCSLWEAHMIGVGRGLLRLRESAAGTVADGYERLARRPFPRLRPRPLWYERPLYYKGNPATFIGDGDTVRWPAYAQALDYELEIGVIIARDGQDLTRDEALGVVGGFVLLNDFSARDVQFREMVEGLMGPAKSKDFGTALGSVVVTASEVIPVLDALTTEVRVNGERWGAGSTAGMQHSVADVIAYASAGDFLAAGTVIGLGMVPGCSGIEAGRWLSPGDVVELSAGPLGLLRNTVGELPRLRPGRAVRRHPRPPPGLGNRPARRRPHHLRRLPRAAQNGRGRSPTGAGRHLRWPSAQVHQQRRRSRRRHGLLLRQLHPVPDRALQAGPARAPA